MITFVITIFILSWLSPIICMIITEAQAKFLVGFTQCNKIYSWISHQFQVGNDNNFLGTGNSFWQEIIPWGVTYFIVAWNILIWLKILLWQKRILCVIGPPEQLLLNKFFYTIIPFMRPSKIQNGRQGPQNGQQGLERCLSPHFWVLRPTFSK